jgi:thiol:disulfide interchange protein DsbC
MHKLVYFLLVSLLIFVAQACAAPDSNYDKQAHDCAKCHTLNDADAAALLKDAIPDLKILLISQGPVKGSWEVMLQSGDRKGIVYVDYSKKTFLSGQIIDIKEKKNLTKDRFDELNKVDASKIPLDDALVMGDPKAKYRVIVFTDPDCPYCGKLHGEMKKILEKRKDIVFFIKMYPLPMHPNAYWKAKSIVCKKSLKMLEDNFEQKEIEKAECATTAIDDNMKLAAQLGINGTPASVLPDGRIISGALEAAALIEQITKK